MSHFSIPTPPAHRKGCFQPTNTRALRWPFQITGLVAIGAMLLLLAHGFLPDSVAKILAAWLPIERFTLGAVAFVAFALVFTIVALDWILVDRAINHRWPRARAKVTSVKIETKSDEAIRYYPAIHGYLLGEADAAERELIIGPQVGWSKESAAHSAVAARVEGGECNVAIEQGESARLFVLPWKTPIWPCAFMGLLPWAIILGILLAVRK
jgi:hypothetical protein